MRLGIADSTKCTYIALYIQITIDGSDTNNIVLVIASEIIQQSL